MSIKSIWKSIIGSPVVITEAQKAVAALKNTSIGQAVTADINAMNSGTLTGPQKFEAVVSNTAPLISNLLTKEARVTLVKDVEDIARALVQDIYNDLFSTKAGSIAALILKLLAK